MGQCFGRETFEVSTGPGVTEPLNIAFIGNSFTFYNDMPHMVEAILSKNVSAGVRIGACLHGGTNFGSLWTKGADMERASRCLGQKGMFPTVKELLEAPDGWDVLVLQDNSQSPAKSEARAEGLKSLEESYIPSISALAKRTGKKPLILLYSTWGYVAPNLKTWREAQFGDCKTMSRMVSSGYYQYASLLEEKGFQTDTVKCGAAFETIYDRNEDLWKTLFQPDNFHPSPKASYLIASMFALTIANHFVFSGQLSRAGTLRITPQWPVGIVPAGPEMDPNDSTKQKNGDTPDLCTPSDSEILEVLQTVGGFIP